MDRRLALRIVVAGLATTAGSVPAQQQASPRRIAVLMGYPEDDPQSPVHVAAFQSGLRQVGLQPGRDVLVDYRWAGVDRARAHALSREIVSTRPAVIVASTNQVVSILMAETKTIPIVFVFVGDPIGSGYVATLAKPGANLTGFSNFEAPIGGKWLEMLREISPTTTRVAFVHHPAASPHLEFLSAASLAAPTFGFQLTSVPVTSAADIRDRLGAFARAGPGGGIIVAPHALTLGSSGLLTALAVQHRLPAVYGDRHFMRSGGLMCFGINLAEQLRRAGAYVDRILKGEKPANLPVQLPTKYDLVINMATARSLGLTVPAMLLARADEVLE